MGVDPVDPFISDFAAWFPRRAITATGVEVPDTRAHGANESLHPGEFARVGDARDALPRPAART